MICDLLDALKSINSRQSPFYARHSAFLAATFRQDLIRFAWVRHRWCPAGNGLGGAHEAHESYRPDVWNFAGYKQNRRLKIAIFKQHLTDSSSSSLSFASSNGMFVWYRNSNGTDSLVENKLKLIANERNSKCTSCQQTSRKREAINRICYI